MVTVVKITLASSGPVFSQATATVTGDIVRVANQQYTVDHTVKEWTVGQTYNFQGRVIVLNGRLAGENVIVFRSDGRACGVDEVEAVWSEWIVTQELPPRKVPHASSNLHVNNGVISKKNCKTREEEDEKEVVVDEKDCDESCGEDEEEEEVDVDDGVVNDDEDEKESEILAE